MRDQVQPDHPYRTTARRVCLEIFRDTATTDHFNFNHRLAVASANKNYIDARMRKERSDACSWIPTIETVSMMRSGSTVFIDFKQKTGR
jgi:hypothetical protein